MMLLVLLQQSRYEGMVKESLNKDMEHLHDKTNQYNTEFIQTVPTWDFHIFKISGSF
jgi:hypothetical protein